MANKTNTTNLSKNESENLIENYACRAEFEETGEVFYRLINGDIVNQNGEIVDPEIRPDVFDTLFPNAIIASLNLTHPLVAELPLSDDDRLDAIISLAEERDMCVDLLVHFTSHLDGEAFRNYINSFPKNIPYGLRNPIYNSNVQIGLSI